jgi:hypothetical protein
MCAPALYRDALDSRAVVPACQCAGSAAFCPVTAVYACFANAILMPM